MRLAASEPLLHIIARTIVVIVMVLLVILIVWVLAILDFLRADERDTRIFTKEDWFVIIILGNVIGAVAWFIAGRPRRYR